MGLMQAFEGHGFSAEGLGHCAAGRGAVGETSYGR